MADLTPLFLCLEDIIPQSSELTNGIYKEQLPGSTHTFSDSFEVLWEIREVKLLQIMLPIVLRTKGGGGHISD